MSRHFVAFVVLAVTGAAVSAGEPALARGGVRAMPGGGFRAPFIIQRNARAGILRASPRAFGLHGAHAFRPHAAGRSAHPAIPPSPHGFATTTPLHPHSRLVRRHHGIYHSGWYFPTTIGGDSSYIGTPYDPAEAIPVYGPETVTEDADPAPSRPRAPATAARAANGGEENRDACRSERVTVPASEGEREILVVRC